MKIRKFKLSEQFLEPYKTKEVPWGPVGYPVFKRTYARLLSETEPGTEGTEEWWQACRRVIEGMFDIQKQHIITHRLPWNDAKAQQTAKDAYERMFVMKWLPPGRGIWLMGSKFVEERGGAALNNCAFVSTKRLAEEGGALFSWIMDALMLGIGVGFDTKGHHTLTIQAPGSTTSKPNIPDQPFNTYYVLDTHPEQWICSIADNREGWVESLQVLLDAVLTGAGLPTFQYHEIRDAGVLIKGFGGTSSGYKPLEQLHLDILELYLPLAGKLITDVVITDTENLTGVCVVSGNVRRSAAISLGSHTSIPFMTMKDDTEKLEHHRWGSNNSVFAHQGMDYSYLAKQVVSRGEPGLVWLKNWQDYGRMTDPQRYDDLGIEGVNPCGEQGLYHKELCTLAENFLASHDDLEDLLATFKISYLYAKTVTLTQTHWPETNAVMLMNRRIGLGVSGVVQGCNKFGYSKTMAMLDEAYDYVTRLDIKYSNWLCVPVSKKRTTIKPSGTTSKLPGATPGAHYPEAEYWINRIRFSEQSDMLPALRAAGHPVEPCVYSPNTMVVSFPVKEPHFVKSKNDITLWEQLELAAQLQSNWSDNGVSITVTFKNHEAQDIERALEMYESRLKAVSFLRYSETGYKQAPMEAMTEAEYIVMSGAITPVQSFNTNEQGVGEKFCDTDSCAIDFSSLTQK